MEVESSFRPIRAQDSVEDPDEGSSGDDNNQRLDAGFANELEAYQGLQLDFESEFADFLSRDVPSNTEDSSNGNNRSRRSSNPNPADHLTQHRLEYNADGTINCCDINYGSLCMITGLPSLDRLTSLTISVASFNSSDNLSALSYCTPGLTTLRLDNSRIQSLRVLGDELHRLRTLSVCYCGLEDLDGISYAPNIVSLCAADNHISDVYPITELRKIHTLDLENNDFEEYGSISFLFICPKLENLVLKGNPISYEPEYRPTIFRILPSLKNLDVIMMKRVPKTICKKDSSPSEDDNFDGSASNGVASSDIPKELEEVMEEDEATKKPKEEPPPNPLEDKLIQDLINQKSEDEQESTKQEEAQNGEPAEEEEEKQESIEEEESKEEIVNEPQVLEEPTEEEVKEDEESLSMSLSKTSEVSEEILDIPELMESFSTSNNDIDSMATSEKEEGKPKDQIPHQPVIMDKSQKETSPQKQTASTASKLLNRRKSVDPVRFREIRRELFGADDFSLKLDDDPPPQPQPASRKEPTTPTDPNSGFTPNLARFMKTTDKSKQQQRPDSSMSFSSTATTSYSHSISEADSGLGDVGSLSSGHSGSMKRPVESSLPRLEARTGTGLKANAAPQLETPSKRTKKTDKAKLLRTNSDLSGKLTTEGDVEIEDFD